MSEHSRNRKAGIIIGEGGTIEEAKQELIQEETARQLLQELEEKQKEAEEQQRKQERKNLINGICNLLGFIFNPIALFIIFLIWSYFYFAVPILNK